MTLFCAATPMRSMVIRGAADLIFEKLSSIIFLDAFIPRHGQSIQDFLLPISVDRQREWSANAETGG